MVGEPGEPCLAEAGDQSQETEDQVVNYALEQVKTGGMGVEIADSAEESKLDQILGINSLKVSQFSNPPNRYLVEWNAIIKLDESAEFPVTKLKVVEYEEFSSTSPSIRVKSTWYGNKDATEKYLAEEYDINKNNFEIIESDGEVAQKISEIFSATKG